MNRPRVVFVLDRLAVSMESDFTPPNALLRAEDVAASFYLALEPIANCPLRMSGCLESVFFNFGPGRLFSMDLNDPNSAVSSSLAPKMFEKLLAEMFATGRLVNPNTQQEYCRRVDGFNDLPANSRIIAIVSGDTSASNTISFGDYISALPDSEPLVFVVGRRVGIEIEARINDTLKVSQYELSDSACLSRVIAKLESKWDI